MKYKMIPVEQFWKEHSKGKHQQFRTLVLVELPNGELEQDFAYVMTVHGRSFFDYYKQGGSHRHPIKYVLVRR